MAITPNEISNKDFKKVFRGYDIDEVDEFLEQIVEEYEKLYKENITNKEKAAALNEKLEHYSNMESTLQSTLLLAQSAAEQAKESSKKEAELIIKDAQETAAGIIKKAEDRVAEINKEYEILKQQFNMFKSRFVGLLQAQMDSIEKSATDLGIEKQ
ncbi:septum formation initiator [Fervidicella metallireducens AeB]|uniref:Septum formation initiator n=1 Tax=Fervidicella metallireducens AeB TaxID=1403537 RepID=A0A017RUY6_9CLOT|nr:DivIVA domain-containing protein [Fervidicella metallireducens]EYE88426.1 septum formation initiator [Fervidicella metallireducens AeB]